MSRVNRKARGEIFSPLRLKDWNGRMLSIAGNEDHTVAVNAID